MLATRRYQLFRNATLVRLPLPGAHPSRLAASCNRVCRCNWSRSGCDQDRPKKVSFFSINRFKDSPGVMIMAAYGCLWSWNIERQTGLCGICKIPSRSPR